MRGYESIVTNIRKKVFTEVAKLAYEGGDYSRMEALPYTLVPGEINENRSSIFLSRAIAGERVRLAMGLPLRPVQEHKPLSDGVNDSAIAEKYYDPPLINIITYACNACPPKQMYVSDLCQGCLSRSCQQVCPKQAVSFDRGRSHIDQDACIYCGKCADACPYHAIIKLERPCEAACGMDAIEKDEYGRARINQDKCVSCGQCLVSCPFGAIVDKGQIFQLIHAMKKGYKVYAIVAPAFVGQFGDYLTPEKLTAAMKMLGFEGVVEVAVGADLCTLDEAKEYLERVAEGGSYMGTSCCPAWISMVETYFPDQVDHISMTLTPMVLTARMVKKEHPDAKVCFVGPCAAKKLEASREHIRSDVDFVLTFEELQGMFEAKEIWYADVEGNDPLDKASADGRGFAVSGGVAAAVQNVVKQMAPDVDMKIMGAEGLRECRKMMMQAKTGKLNGYLLEGMACPGGCIAGAGTIRPIKKAAMLVDKYKKEAPVTSATESEYKDLADSLD
ncbi:MAG: 4Fe-4S dicluster domain-containing protein [Oscillospiraceae bacterium]|nr:4Fe-4S dicluster domain-containing protein [Oscillospiraceae bacterium]